MVMHGRIERSGYCGPALGIIQPAPQVRCSHRASQHHGIEDRMPHRKWAEQENVKSSNRCAHQLTLSILILSF